MVEALRSLYLQYRLDWGCVVVVGRVYMLHRSVVLGGSVAGQWGCIVVVQVPAMDSLCSSLVLVEGNAGSAVVAMGRMYLLGDAVAWAVVTGIVTGLVLVVEFEVGFRTEVGLEFDIAGLGVCLASRNL